MTLEAFLFQALNGLASASSLFLVGEHETVCSAPKALRRLNAVGAWLS